MGAVDWIRGLFGGKQSGADHGALAGGAAAATSGNDHTDHVDSQAGSGWGGGDSSGDGGGSSTG
jgi:hypothetical protein